MKKSIFILLFALLGVLSARAYDFEVDGIYYNILSGTTDKVEVTGSYENRYTGSVVIPSTVTYDGNTYTVTAIRSVAFYNCSGLTSVTIPASVTTIGDKAFYNCSGLTTVTIPESVTTIGNSAFYNCTSISSPLYNSKVFAYMPQNYSGEYAIPSGIQTIVGSAFSGCTGLTSVTIPNSVTTIGSYAFEVCYRLTSVTIPEGVTSIGDYAFESCSGLTSVTIPNSVTSIGYGAFSGSGLTSVTIPESVDTIRDRTFSGCNVLTSVTIPNSVTTIGSYAFSCCFDLTSVTIPEGVTSIGDYAFDLCYGLTSVTIGKSVTTIGKKAFYSRRLTSVKSLAEIPPPSCDESAFGDDDYYTMPLYVPAGSKPFYTVAQGWRKFAKIEEFEANTYTVTVQPNDAAMGTVTGGGEYKEGEQAMLAAIPNQGYYFVRWDDGSTNNPRIMTVSKDITLTVIFAKNGDAPTANENPEADNFRVYVQDRTIHLSEARGAVQVYNVAGQCIYNGHATAIPVPQSGLYILVAGSQRFKVLVR